MDGLLLRYQGTLYLLPDPDNPANREALLSGAIGGSVAFDADDNLYISNAGNRRVLRVSPDPHVDPNASTRQARPS